MIEVMLSPIREKLKRVPFVHALHGYFQAMRNRGKLKALSAHYEALASSRGLVYSDKRALEMFQASVAGRGLHLRSVLQGKLNVFWVGANEPQDRSGFLQSLARFGEVNCFKNSKGGYGLRLPEPGNRRFHVPDIAADNGERLVEQVRGLHARSPVHAVLGQMWRWLVHEDALVQVQKMGIVTINVSMDDRLPLNWESAGNSRIGAIGLSRGTDLVLTSSPECCPWYMVEGTPCIYWPMASDPGIFYPRPEKRHDVVFVGTNYGLRSRIVAALRRSGVSVDAYGPGWPNGPVDAFRMAELFGSAKIILGTGGVGYDRDIQTLKLRDFDAPMSGALYITHRNPDLLRFFVEGEEIECYWTIEECVAKVKRYLADPPLLARVAGKGHVKALSSHSWDGRFTDLFRLIRSLG